VEECAGRIEKTGSRALKRDDIKFEYHQGRAAKRAEEVTFLDGSKEKVERKIENIINLLKIV